MKRILDPKNDCVFKMLFSKDTEILLDLIESVLSRPGRRKIRSVEVKNPTILPEEIGGKFIVLDIRAEDESGGKFDIEMQVRKYESYSKRSLYYLCKLYADQLDSGEEYGELKPVVGIHFLDYEEFAGNPEFHFKFAFRDLRHPEVCLTDDLALHIVELPVFKREMPENVPAALTEWIRFFNNAENETEETVKQYTNTKVPKAYDALKALSADEEARLRAEARERALKDEVSELNAARREGKREGMSEIIIDNLEIRFGNAPDSIKRFLFGCTDPGQLKALNRKALTAATMDEFMECVS
jgi:predicted transposase/invertase (TIGR01784 family)